MHSVDGPQRTFTSTAPGPMWTDNGWTAFPAGDYTIAAGVTNAGGCTQTAAVDVTATVPPAPGP